MTIFKREKEAELILKKELLDFLLEREKQAQARLEAILAQKIDLESDVERLMKELEKDNG